MGTERPTPEEVKAKLKRYIAALLHSRFAETNAVAALDMLGSATMWAYYAGGLGDDPTKYATIIDSFIATLEAQAS